MESAKRTQSFAAAVFYVPMLLGKSKTTFYPSYKSIAWQLEFFTNLISVYVDVKGDM